VISGIGIDAVSLERVKKLGPHFLEKVYNERELADYALLKEAHEDIKAQFLASRFAVKEAYAKARGTGFCEVVIPKDIYVEKDSNGRPFVGLSGVTLDNAPCEAIHLSITHESPLAIAMVVLEREGWPSAEEAETALESASEDCNGKK
jgi:holo-[acyl-carrier protein] synthase